MIRLKPLPPIALTNLQPAFYDVESVTAIEMVSKLYAYLQNMVNDYNSFITEVNNEIENFENDINYNIQEFESCIRNLMSEFIESIDIKIDLQDAKIENAIEYMKDNIIETTTTIIDNLIQNGEINVSISYDSETESLDIIVTREDD